MLSTLNVSCKACTGEKKDADTVKIDMNKLQASGKENASPAFDQHEQERRRKEEEQKAAEARKRAEEIERKRREEEERKRREAVAEAARRRAAEEEEQRRIEEENARRQIEEEARRLEQQRLEIEEKRRIAEEQKLQAELARKRREEELQRKCAEEAQRKREELERAQKKLNTLLQKGGYKEVNEKKRKAGVIFSSFSYPLHTAVEAGDEEAVRILLWGGADRSVTNSKKQTPLELAQKRGKKGANNGIIALLAN